MSERNEIECPREQNINILKGAKETRLLLFGLNCHSSHVQQEEIKNWTTGWRNKMKNNLGEKICMWESKKTWKYPLISHNAKKESSGSI